MGLVGSCSTMIVFESYFGGVKVNIISDKKKSSGLAAMAEKEVKIILGAGWWGM